MCSWLAAKGANHTAASFGLPHQTSDTGCSENVSAGQPKWHLSWFLLISRSFFGGSEVFVGADRRFKTEGWDSDLHINLWKRIYPIIN